MYFVFIVSLPEVCKIKQISTWKHHNENIINICCTFRLFRDGTHSGVMDGGYTFFMTSLGDFWLFEVHAGVGRLISRLEDYKSVEKTWSFFQSVGTKSNDWVLHICISSIRAYFTAKHCIIFSQFLKMESIWESRQVFLAAARNHGIWSQSFWHLTISNCARLLRGISPVFWIFWDIFFTVSVLCTYRMIKNLIS